MTVHSQMPATRRPAERKVGAASLLRDVPKALRMGPGCWRDFAVATMELAYASYRLRRVPAADFQLRRDAGGEDDALTPSRQDRCDRVAYALPVMAARVPWRSDCLVQALAGRRWLAREGISSSIRIGSKRDTDGVFLAHAWLVAGGRVVTGGDVASYAEFPMVGDSGR